VRGKNILWLSLIAMLLSVMMVNVGTAPEAVKLYIDPTRLPEQAGTMGHIGDVYEVAVKIENVENLWSVGFTIKYAPYVRTLVVSEPLEGPFLKEGWAPGTYFKAVVNSFEGELNVVIARLGMPGVPAEGAFGDGVLMTLKFNVIEAGDSPIDIIDSTLVNIELTPINHKVWGSYYHGCTANLIRANMPDGRRPKVGDVINFNTKAVNKGDVPIYVRARYYFIRKEDGRAIEIYAGQNYGGGGLGEPLPYEYFYVDGYRENPLIGGHEWYNEGDSMVGEPDDDYMYANSAYAWSMFYSFEDVTLAGREIANVDLYGYTSQPDGSTDWDFDPYVFPWGAWCDSMGGTPDWAWTGGRYYKGSAYDMPEYYIGAAMHTEEGFNSAEVMIENYCPSGPEQRIDAMRWKVEFSPITPVEPPVFLLGPYGSETQEIELDPVTWPVTEDHIGTYDVQVTIEYSELYPNLGFTWKNMGEKVATFSFEITE
jgi:hypothetical protein